MSSYNEALLRVRVSDERACFVDWKSQGRDYGAIELATHNIHI